MSAITLTNWQILTAADVGIRRHLVALQRKLAEPAGHPAGEPWAVDIEAAAAEYAAAIALNQCWNMAIGEDLRRKPPDLGREIEVRSTPVEDGHLIVRAGENPDWFYVLVVGRIPSFRVVGAIRGFEAQRQEWLRQQPGRLDAWFVPQSVLRAWWP